MPRAPPLMVNGRDRFEGLLAVLGQEHKRVCVWADALEKEVSALRDRPLACADEFDGSFYVPPILAPPPVLDDYVPPVINKAPSALHYVPPSHSVPEEGQITELPAPHIGAEPPFWTRLKEDTSNDWPSVSDSAFQDSMPVDENGKNGNGRFSVLGELEAEALHVGHARKKRRSSRKGRPGSTGRFTVEFEPTKEGVTGNPAKMQTNVMANFAEGSPLALFVHGVYFEITTGVLIISSAIALGFETDHMARSDGTSSAFYILLQAFFNTYFILELGIRLLVDRWIFFTSVNWRWNYLDIFLTMTCITDLLTAFLHLRYAFAGRFIRAIRLLRLLRTVRLVRALRFLREFHKMLYAVLSCGRTLLCSLIILSFVIYFFAILFCQAVIELKSERDEDGLPPELPPFVDERYGNLSNALYSLFASASQGIDWDQAYSPLMLMGKGYGMCFFVYIVVILFGVTNVVTSVFVESAIMSAQHYKDLIIQEKQYAKEVAVKHMKEVFRQIDQDGSGEISKDEMEYFLTEPDLISYVDALGISAESTRMLFRLMDVDGSGRIDVDEFCEGCLRLQGEAKSMDVHTMIYQVKQFLAKWSEFTAYCEERFASISTNINRVNNNMRSASMESLEVEAPQPRSPLAGQSFLRAIW